MIRKVFAVAAVVLLGAIVYLTVAPVAAQDKGNERVLSKVTFIHFRKAPAKPSGVGGGKTGPGYYTYIAEGARWRTLEDLRVNPTNGDGVAVGDIANAVGAGMAEWETPGKKTLDIFRNVELDPSVTYDDGAFRGYNTISFGSYGNQNVIAVTTVWGYFGGKPSQREILEAHILMNDYYVWGDAALNPSVMDLQNIFTHELGHVAGMGDLYQSAAREETMFGYSSEGETKKRDLYKGDVTGITSLYR